MSDSGRKEQTAFTADFIKSISQKPGVYLMKDRQDAVLYVGKAKNLRKRLTSYARHDLDRQSKTAVLLGKVRNVETILTRTEKEALILESALIKKHRPRYNVILRDDKSYPYLKVTVQETWPRLVMTRQRKKDGARYFGPYSSASAMWETLRLLNEHFPLRRCKEPELKTRKRSCLNYQIGRCPGLCIGKISRDGYLELVHNVVMVLEGRNRHLVAELDRKMRQASDRLDFEQAAALRDRTAALRETLERQIVADSHDLDQDVFGFIRKEEAVAVSVILVRHGSVVGTESFFLAAPLGNDAEILAEVLERYYAADRHVPAEVLLPFEPEGRATIGEWLADIASRKVGLRVPQRGRAVRLLDMAKANSEKVLTERARVNRSWESLAAVMQEKFGLSRLPDAIECLDISNLGGLQSVGALVSYKHGEKDTSGYRHYKIRSIATPDDYAMMNEVLYRRFRDAGVKENLPDLLIIDGGKGHLQVAVRVLTDLGLTENVDLLSIAKEKTEEGEKIFRPGRKNPVSLARHSPLLLFVMRVRDEAHRYGITFHRRWRGRAALHSRLDGIPGVGPARRRALLSSLGSMKRIEEASVESLAAVEGIGPALARQIYDHLHGNSG